MPGLIYLLCIPSMYLLLIIYSITNLNVVSWGTREVAQKKSKKEMADEKKVAEANKTKVNNFLNFPACFYIPIFMFHFEL